MTDLTPDHPAVLAADAAVREKDGLDASYLVSIPHALTAALPHLNAATEDNLARLRNTPAGRELLAEGWDEAIYDTGAWKQLVEFPPNPYKEETTHDRP